MIIVAGGIGTRMKSDRPKQFMEIGGKAVIIHTLLKFLDYDPGLSIIICVHRNYRTHLESLLERARIATANIRIVFGGETRFDSVKNGLNAIAGSDGVVGIHDAARPLVSVQTISTCYEVAAARGNAVPCVAVSDSLRKISNNVNTSLNRNEFKIVQTPQCFNLLKLKHAFDTSFKLAFTDDASVYEASGETVVLVEGNEENIKITAPHHLVIAGALLK